jgi:hypothetical protein
VERAALEEGVKTVFVTDVLACRIVEELGERPVWEALDTIRRSGPDGVVFGEMRFVPLPFFIQVRGAPDDIDRVLRKSKAVLSENRRRNLNADVWGVP